MNTPILSLNLTVRSQNGLTTAGINTVELLAEFVRQYGVTGLMKIQHLGPRSVDEIFSAFCQWLFDSASVQPSGNSGPPVPLRDYFAAKAMQGFAASDDTIGWKSIDHVAETAYEWADAMLKAREDGNE